MATQVITQMLEGEYIYCFSWTLFFDVSIGFVYVAILSLNKETWQEFCRLIFLLCKSQVLFFPVHIDLKKNNEKKSKKNDEKNDEKNGRKSVYLLSVCTSSVRVQTSHVFVFWKQVLLFMFLTYKLFCLLLSFFRRRSREERSQGMKSLEEKKERKRIEITGQWLPTPKVGHRVKLNG